MTRKAIRLSLLLSGAFAAVTAHADLMITAVVDGPEWQKHRAIELYATQDIPDLAAYVIGVEANSNDSIGNTYALPSVSLTAGTYYWIGNGTAAEFETYFGFAPGAAEIGINGNGDDRYAILDVNTSQILDIYGEQGVDGSGTAWEYTDGWAARDQSEGPSATFDTSEWTFSGTGALSNTATNPSIPVEGVAPAGPTIPDIGTCGTDATLISQVQGDTGTPDELGNYHAVEATLHQLAADYSGFFLQEEDADSDNDSTTSEGVFVYLGWDYDDYVSNHNLAVGDQVRLVAKVSEYGNITQLSDLEDFTVCATGQSLPTPAALSFPLTSLDELEAVEGMSVSLSQNMVVSDFFGNGYGWLKYGQFVASSELHYQPTAIETPSAEGYDAAVEARTLDSILIDDGSSSRNPEIIPFPTEAGFSNTNYFRVGYGLSNLHGAIHGYANSNTKLPYALLPTITPTFDSAGNDRTLEPEVDRSGNLVVASMNVLNLFNGVEDPDVNNGETFFPTAEQADSYGHRGAYSEADYLMQRGKIVAALKAIDADLIGLMEIENDGYGELSSIKALVTALNAEMPAHKQYDFVAPVTANGKIGTDAIAVGLLYRSDILSRNGDAVILDSTNSPTDDNGEPLFLDSKNRPSLIQSFTHEDSGETLTASINHLKSKGSSCDSLGDPDLNDGAGNCNLTRTRAVEGLVAFLEENPTGVETENLLIMGDMNAYAKETPIQAFEEAGIVNLKDTDKSTEALPFSYSYSGFLGSLDYIFGSTSVTDALLSIDAWHINSVEANAFDYDTALDEYDDNDSYASEDPYFSSDHDPIIASFHLAANSDDEDEDEDNSNDTGNSGDSDDSNGSDDSNDSNDSDNSDVDVNVGAFGIWALFAGVLLAIYRRRPAARIA